MRGFVFFLGEIQENAQKSGKKNIKFDKKNIKFDKKSPLLAKIGKKNIKFNEKMIKRLYVVSKEIKDKIPDPHRLIDKHYVLEYKENNVCVFTRHPLKNYKTYLISNETIDKRTGNQYLTGILYKIDSSNTKLVESPEALEFSIKNMHKIVEFKKEIPSFPLIELSKFLPAIGGI